MNRNTLCETYGNERKATLEKKDRKKGHVYESNDKVLKN